MQMVNPLTETGHADLEIHKLWLRGLVSYD
jgi:hypothetical protein